MIAVRQWPSSKKSGKGPRTKRQRAERLLRAAERERDVRVEVVYEDPDPIVVAILRAKRRAA